MEVESRYVPIVMEILKCRCRIMQLYENIFLYSVLGLHIAYLLLAIGIFKKEPAYLKEFDFWLKVGMSGILIWSFNPYSSRSSEFDRKIAFSAGMFLALTTIVDRYLSAYVDAAKKVIHIF